MLTVPVDLGPVEEPIGILASEFRMPAAARPGIVRLLVGNLERSLAFYCGVVGFQLVGRAGRTASLGAVGSATPLIELTESAGAVPSPVRGRLGLNHFALCLPDRTALGRLLSHLAAIGELVGGADHGVSEAIYVRDPDGIGLEIAVDRPRPRWDVRGAELVMETRGLDREGLLRLAGDRRWHGVPVSTQVGHLHLHVGELEEALEFYHLGVGLDLTVWNQPGALYLSAGGYHHHLAIDTWAGGAAGRPLDGEARLVEWELVVPEWSDVIAAARSLASLGHRVSWEGSGWTVEDPWSNRLRVRV